MTDHGARRTSTADELESRVISPEQRATLRAAGLSPMFELEETGSDSQPPFSLPIHRMENGDVVDADGNIHFSCSLPLHGKRDARES